MFKAKQAYTCPYCLCAFEKEQALFRCSALPQVCAHEADEAYQEFFGSKGEGKKGRLIKVKKRSSSKAFLKRMDDDSRVLCDACATPTKERVCPACHGALPSDFFQLVHMPLGVYGTEKKLFQFFVTALTKKMTLITGHDVNATLKTLPDLNGFVFHFDSDDLALGNVLVSFHDILSVAGNKLESLENVLFFEHIGALFKEKEKKISAEVILSVKKKLAPQPIMGLQFYGLDEYFGYFPRASSVLDAPDFSDGYDKNKGEWVSQELLTLFGASYGVNFLRQIREQFTPWRFGACSFVENQNVPLASFHRVEDLFLWQLFQ